MTYRHPDAVIQIFARAPVPGAVKTRLIPALGAEGAAALQAKLLFRTLEMATRASMAPVQLWCAPDCRHAAFQDWPGVSSRGRIWASAWPMRWRPACGRRSAWC